MTVMQLLKKLGYQIRTLGFVGVLIGAPATWWTITRIEEDTRIATDIGNLMMIMAVAIPLSLAGMAYLEKETIASAPRKNGAIALGIIGLFSGLFASLVYFFIGFQVPTLFAGADNFVIFDILVPYLFSTGLIVTFIGAIAGALIGFYWGAPTQSGA